MKHLFKSATLIVATLLVGFVMQSCNSTKPIDKEQLKGHWILQTINGEKVSDIHKGAKPTIEFNFEDMRVNGSAGCNNYFGGFSLSEDNKFTAAQLAMTNMACPEMDIESKFAQALSTTDVVLSLDTEKEEISFKAGDKVLLVFKKGEVQVVNQLKAINLENLAGDWKLSQISDASIAELFGDRLPTMKIEKDGKISGFAGCNRFSSSLTIEQDDVLKLTMPASTRMACDHLKGEGLFTSLLKGELKAQILNDELSLSAEGIVVLKFVKYDAE